MGRTLIPQEELRGSVPRLVCPVCNKHRYWTIESGLEASILGRYIVVKCKTCGCRACWAQ